MKLSEIPSMPAGRELDALVAEHVMDVKDPRRDWHWKMTLPNYSTSIAAAWQVVEKIDSYFSLIRSNDSGWGPAPFLPAMVWRCRFYAPQKFDAMADTAPLAICRAALLAVTEGQR